MSIRIRINWGIGVGLVYGLFVAGTISFVIFALSRPVELVSADYYDQSLTYDDRLEAARLGQALGDAVHVTAVPDDAVRGLIVALPRGQADAARGTLTLYRPSHAAADRVVPLALDVRGEQRVSTAGLEPGRWIVKISWQVQGRRYYREEAVQLP
jgi:nitrogen fixation protein FixH